jgi:hypothetical protein
MVTRRTIEAHLQQDQNYLWSLSSQSESALFVKSCIDRTIQLLSEVKGAPRLLDTAPDAGGSGGSHPEGPEGALLSSFISD